MRHEQGASGPERGCLSERTTDEDGGEGEERGGLRWTRMLLDWRVFHDWRAFHDWRNSLDWRKSLDLRVSRPSPGVVRAARAAASLAVWVFAAAGVAIGGLFLALSRGPIALDWLAPTIVESLDELYRHKYKFGLRAATIVNADHGPTLSIDALTVKSEGRIVLAAPRAELSIDVRALFLGRLRPRRIEALDLELRLLVRGDGTIAVAAGTGAGEPVAIEPPRTDSVAPPGERAPPHQPLLQQAAEGLRDLFDLVTSPDGAIGGVDRLGVAHGRLVIDDKTVGRVIRYEDLSFGLDKGADGVKFELSARGASRRWAAVATVKGGPGQRRMFDLALRDFSIDEIALAGGLRNLNFDMDAPLSLDMHASVASDDQVLEASGHVGVGAGFFRFDDPEHEPVLIDAVSGAMRWDRGQRRFIVDPFVVKAGGFDMTLEGAAAAPGDSGSSVDGGAWDITARLAAPTLAAPDRAGRKSVRIERARMNARFFPAAKKMTFDRIEIGGPELNASFEGAFDWLNGRRLVYDLNITDTQTAALLRLWPTNVAGKARGWFAEHVGAGVVRHANVKADFDDAALTAMRYERPPPDQALRCEGEVVNLSFSDLLPGLPPVTGVSGQFRTSGRTVRFTARSGAMEIAREHRLTLAEGGFIVPDNAPSPTPAVLDVRLSGNIEAATAILAVPSIAPYANLPMEPGALKGQIDGRLHVEFELGREARANHTQVTIDATTSNLSIDRFAGDERFDNAALDIVSDRAGLRVAGTGRLYGAPATLDLRHPRGEKGPAQAQLSLVFSDAARAKAGFGFPGVGGPVAAVFKTSLPVGETDMRIELDLSKATLDNPLPGLAKPAGKPGKAAFLLSRRPEGIILDQFSLEAGGAHVAGRVELTREGGFRSAKLSQLRLSPGDEARVDAHRSGDALKIVARGANIDARPMLRSLTQPGPERAAPAGGAKGAASFDDVDLDLKSSIMTGYGKQILANVDLKLERRSGRLRALALNGKLGREPLAAAMTRDPGGAAQIELSAGDGGSLMSFLDFYHKMDGGALSTTIRLGQGLGQDRADGVLHIRDFYLKGEPAMRQLMTQGAARADDRGNIRFDPESVHVARLQADFTREGGRLSLRDGVMSGPEMGLTFDGFIDFAHERIDVGGSYVPAYELNNLLSNIPVIGVLLAGGRHEGVFALNYRATGRLGSPDIGVNPLSALAPGLMRKIMGILDGSTRPPDGGGR